MTLSSSFMDNWILSKTWADPRTPRKGVAAYQVRALRQTLAHAKTQSRFYRDRLSEILPEDIRDIKDMARLPLTTPAHIQADPAAFLCLSQDEISRIITLNTSGTTAPAKRIFFTDQDLEQTVDFFSQILYRIMKPGETGIILLPGSTPGSAGDLINRAMKRVHARGIVLGVLQEFSKASDLIASLCPSLIIGMPAQVLALCEHLKLENTSVHIPHVILTADHLPLAVDQRIRDGLDCRVLNHYGMTETGFGGAIQCPAQDGLHPREPDLIFEIIDPATKAVLPPGQWGEILVTTLNRRGMPLIRYRTGDMSRVLDRPCACGSPLVCLDRIRNRQTAGAVLAPGLVLTMPDLDDIFFALPGVMDFTAGLDRDGQVPVLQIELQCIRYQDALECLDFRELANGNPVLKQALDTGVLRLAPLKTRPYEFRNTYLGKRIIRDTHSDSEHPPLNEIN